MSAYYSFQRTIQKEGSLSGVGIHSGESCRVTFKPVAPVEGIQFFKNGLKVPLSFSSDPQRCTSIGQNGDEIKTVEHLMAALHGFGIDHMRVEVEGPELPALDGSALLFAELFKKLGLKELSSTRDIFKIQEPLFCHEPGKAIAIFPSDSFRISYVLDYDHPLLRGQKVDFVLSPDVFEKEIAPARTFCMEAESLALRQSGFGLGANYENTLVISEKGPIQNQFRFRDECARHKVLDILGDLSLLGYAVVGHVVGIRSGHSLNRQLVQAIQKQRTAMEKPKVKPAAKPYLMDTEAIKQILPHRYPFLFLDRILEMDGTKAVGIKNVTANEPFFQGHFPERPVMPGVLIIEALAQLGGVYMLTTTHNPRRLAYLIAINNARFRKTVVPGDELRLEIEALKIKSKVGIIKGVARVGGEEVCDAEIMFTLVD